MTRNIVFIVFAVILLAVFLAACHPHRWHRGCDGPFGFDHRPGISEHMNTGNYHAGSEIRF